MLRQRAAPTRGCLEVAVADASLCLEYPSDKTLPACPSPAVLWNIKLPLSMCMLCAILVTLWAQLRISCCPGLPSLDPQNVTYNVFRLASFAMSLILSLRISRAYDRW